MQKDNKTNYHIHTYRCGHAKGDIEDYVLEAVNKGFTDIGFADHCPLPDEWWPEIRMSVSQLPDYLHKIDEAREKFINIKIRKGLECDYFKRYESFFKEELPNQYHLDYLVGSVHGYNYQGETYVVYHSDMNASRMAAYAKHYVSAMESGAFSFMAHPDLYCIKVDQWDENAAACAKEIFQAAEELKVPLEINTSGYLKAKGGKVMTPREEFWALASDYQIRVLVNTDAHTPKQIDAFMEQGYELARRNQLSVSSNPFTALT